MHRLSPERSVDPEAELFACGAEHLRITMVTSLDGAASVAGRVGELTSSADQALLHAARCAADVVLVGAGTVRAEGYGPLQVDEATQARRTGRGQTPHPGLAIVTASGKLDPEHPLFTDALTRPVVLTTPRASGLDRLRSVAEVVLTGEHDVDVEVAMTALRARGLGRIGCEGGASLNAALLAADLVDELLLTTAPVVAGGGAPRVVGGEPLAAPRQARLLALWGEGHEVFARWSLR